MARAKSSSAGRRGGDSRASGPGARAVIHHDVSGRFTSASGAEIGRGSGVRGRGRGAQQFLRDRNVPKSKGMQFAELLLGSIVIPTSDGDDFISAEKDSLPYRLYVELVPCARISSSEFNSISHRLCFVHAPSKKAEKEASAEAQSGTATAPSATHARNSHRQSLRGALENTTKAGTLTKVLQVVVAARSMTGTLSAECEKSCLSAGSNHDLLGPSFTNESAFDRCILAFSDYHRTAHKHGSFPASVRMPDTVPVEVPQVPLKSKFLHFLQSRDSLS